ncbi:hypothetical protein P389DRAFT_4672 [Cystobasidium minutum MCA 4210]|uniref:uncharacterized protein n=1 Tax=Cystobasidium minutum MCA 4210 TaxID=1397322 RepID=UPI0034CED0D2|eukprot:jgi/Rhomi1/4672/CE4671_173
MARYLHAMVRLTFDSRPVFPLVIRLYLQGVRDSMHELPENLRSEISALVLTAVACLDSKDIGKPNHYNKCLKLHACWSPESMTVALANPSLSAEEGSLVSSFFARRAPKSIHLDEVMASVCRMLLKDSCGGTLLLKYSDTCSWLPSLLEEVICENGPSSIFNTHVRLQVDMSDPMQAGIHAAVLGAFVKLHGAEPSQPRALPTAIALLSILDRQTSRALPMILTEARKRGETKIIEMYQQQGIVAEL